MTGSEKPFWKKEKIWMAVLGIAAVLTIFLAGTSVGLSAEDRAKAVEAVTWIVAFLMGGHALSDAAHAIASRPSSSPGTPKSVTAPASSDGAEE